MFLIDELHKALNGILAIEDTPLVETNLTDRHQMKHFALEAEMNRNFDLAAYYYQEVFHLIKIIQKFPILFFYLIKSELQLTKTILIVGLTMLYSIY